MIKNQEGLQKNMTQESLNFCFNTDLNANQEPKHNFCISFPSFEKEAIHFLMLLN